MTVLDILCYCISLKSLFQPAEVFFLILGNMFVLIFPFHFMNVSIMHMEVNIYLTIFVYGQL